MNGPTLENQELHLARSHQGRNNEKGKDLRPQGRPGKRPCGDCEVLWLSRVGRHPLQAAFGSVGFQTRRIADPPDWPGVKRRPRWVWKSALHGRGSASAILII
jgi:hypothetical protein